MISNPPATMVSTAMTWASPAVGLWVAHVDGEYAGMIERVDDRFRLTDRKSTLLGTFASRHRAMSIAEDALAVEE